MAANRSLLALVTLALATALLSGCLTDGAASGGDADPSAAGAPDGSQAGSPSSHGMPRRADGPVQVLPEGGQFVARQVVTIANDFGGATYSRLLMTSFNGGLSVEPSTDGGYRFQADLYGRGATEDQAREALAALRLAANDDLAGGTLTLSFELTSGDLPPAPLPIQIGSTANNGGGFKLLVPPQPSHRLDLHTSNGGVHVDGLHGPELVVDTSNGGVSATGAFGSAEIGSSNGGIHLDGTFNDVDAGTSNAGVALDLRLVRSGRIEADTSNGGIHVSVSGPGAAYDVTGDTSNADVEIDLDGNHVEDEDRATYRSPGFSSAAVQVTMALSSSNAGISVED